MNILSLLERLQAVRRGGPLIDAVPLAERPQMLQEAYAIAAALHSPGTEFGGYKIGATSARGRQLLGLAGPFYGRVVKDTLSRSPASIRLGGRTLALEPEIGCQMGVGLPTRGKPYSRGEVAASVRRVVPLIELNCPSFAAPFEVGGLCLIADNGVNVGAVTGYPGSSGLDAIGASHVEVRVNGGAPVRGAPMPVPDDPLSSLAWLANALIEAGLELQAGDIVATGAMSAPIDIAQEANVVADFGLLGVVQVSLL